MVILYSKIVLYYYNDSANVFDYIWTFFFIRCPEALFNPSVLGHESHSYGGVHEAIYNSVARCDIDLRTELFSNILLSGKYTTIDY